MAGAADLPDTRAERAESARRPRGFVVAPRAVDAVL